MIPGDIKPSLAPCYDRRLTDTQYDAATTDRSFVKNWLDKSDTFFLKMEMNMKRLDIPKEWHDLQRH